MKQNANDIGNMSICIFAALSQPTITNFTLQCKCRYSTDQKKHAHQYQNTGIGLVTEEVLGPLKLVEFNIMQSVGRSSRVQWIGVQYLHECLLCLQNCC